MTSSSTSAQPETSGSGWVWGGGAFFRRLLSALGRAAWAAISLATTSQGVTG